LKVLKIENQGVRKKREDKLTNQDIKNILDRLVNDATVGFKCVIERKNIRVNKSYMRL